MRCKNDNFYNTYDIFQLLFFCYNPLKKYPNTTPAKNIKINVNLKIYHFLYPNLDDNLSCFDSFILLIFILLINL